MFDDFLEALKDNHFEETPVDAKTFVESPDYLGQPGLSDIQYDIVEAMSQIYRKEDLIEIMGEAEGSAYFSKYTKNEIILQLGKGSGKDFRFMQLLLSKSHGQIRIGWVLVIDLENQQRLLPFYG